MGRTSREWIGVANYAELLGQGYLWSAMRVSAKFFLAYLFFNMLVSYLLAIGLNKLSPWFCGAMLSLYRIPGLISAISSVVVWRWFYRYEGGLFNSILETIHLPRVLWLGHPSMAAWAICFVIMGGTIGSSTLLYSAALGQVSPELVGAARLDGANELQVIWHIITPLTQPIRLYILLANLIGAMQIWEHPFFFTGGGPLGSTRTMMYEIFHMAFTKNRFGLAAAMTVVTVMMAMSIAMIFMKKLRLYID